MIQTEQGGAVAVDRLIPAQVETNLFVILRIDEMAVGTIVSQLSFGV
jgi:hypothetical protein